MSSDEYRNLNRKDVKELEKIFECLSNDGKQINMMEVILGMRSFEQEEVANDYSNIIFSKVTKPQMNLDDVGLGCYAIEPCTALDKNSEDGRQLAHQRAVDAEVALSVVSPSERQRSGGIRQRRWVAERH